MDEDGPTIDAKFQANFLASLATFFPPRIPATYFLLFILLRLSKIGTPFFTLHSQIQWQQKLMGMVCAADVMPSGVGIMAD